MIDAQQTPDPVARAVDQRVVTATLLEKTWYNLGRTLVGLYAGLLFGMNVHYQAPIPAGAKILAANHPSSVDPILITTLVPEQVSVLINEILFQVPVVGASLRLAGHIRVVHSSGSSALEEGIRYLRAGRTLGIFPEGAISSHEGGYRLPRTGVARLALSTGVPVIPIGISLEPSRIRRIRTRVSGKMEVGTWYLHGPYAVTVGEPMVFAGDVENREYVRSVSETVMRRITALAQEGARRLPVSQAETPGVFRRILALGRKPLPNP